MDNDYADTYYVVIKMKVVKGRDPDEIASEMDYNLDHEDIWDTEVMGVSKEFPL